MRRIAKYGVLLAAIAFVIASAGVVQAAPITFTKLTGLTGGTLAQTGVYRGDLTGMGSILSISITDNSGGVGGSDGEFSGFDLDAIKLSTTSCADAACVKALAGLSVFDFTGGTVFSPGTQRAPADAKLFGTGPAGNTVDNAVATLGSFDAESSTVVPPATGFLSMGDNGSISFNLTSATSSTGLFLYIGEVGDNGEVAASSVTVSSSRVPEPTSLLLLSMGVFGIGLAAYRRKQLQRF